MLSRIRLAPSEASSVSIAATTDKLPSYNLAMQRVAEPGEFRVMVGTSSADNLKSKFEILN